MAKKTKKKARAKRRALPAAGGLERFCSLPEAAKIAGIHEVHLRRLIGAGTVVGVKVGRNYLVDRESAAAFQRHPYLGRPKQGE